MVGARCMQCTLRRTADRQCYKISYVHSDRLPLVVELTLVELGGIGARLLFLSLDSEIESRAARNSGVRRKHFDLDVC